MMELRYDTLHNIPESYWIWSYAGATIFTCNMQDTFLCIQVRFKFVKLKLFWGDADQEQPSINMLTLKNNDNGFYMCIFYIGLNLFFPSSPSFTCIA